jgi:hypothetical protein
VAKMKRKKCPPIRSLDIDAPADRRGSHAQLFFLIFDFLIKPQPDFIFPPPLPFTCVAP